MSPEGSYERLCREARDHGLFPGLVVSRVRYRKRLADQTVMVHRDVVRLTLTGPRGEVVRQATMDGLRELETAAHSLLFNDARPV